MMALGRSELDAIRALPDPLYVEDTGSEWDDEHGMMCGTGVWSTTALSCAKVKNLIRVRLE